MRKRVTAFLTAILCAASVAAVPSSAAVDMTPEYFEGENGRLMLAGESGVKGLYVKTDGTALNEEMASAFGTVSDVCTIAEKIADQPEWATTTGLDTLDADAYILSVSVNMSNEEIMNLGRKLMAQTDFVEDVQVLSYQKYYYDALTITLQFTTKQVSEDAVVDLTAMPELSPYFEYSYSPVGKIGILNPVGEQFSEKFYAETAQDPHSYFTYDSYEYLAEFAKSIQEKYSDVFTSVNPVVLSKMGADEIEYDITNYATSVWTDAGDNNSDGNVTAEDAAGMLTLAAQIGTGADIKATSANDVNSDGTVNAEDAAAVLAYAAANGSGNEVSWVDILRR